MAVLASSNVLHELESLGTEQNRKIYRRHGAGDNLYGVSFANLKELAKRHKGDHQLAIELWDSGNHDARILATMIADPKLANDDIVERWASDLTNYGLADALEGYIAKTALVRQKAEEWIQSGEEWRGSMGWQLVGQLAMHDKDLPDDYFERHLQSIERGIHSAKNRVRYSMNGALIAIGLRNENLKAKALACAERIGKVDVDHGETGCKTPDAVPYILKASARSQGKA